MTATNTNEWTHLYKFKDPSFRDAINIRMREENVQGVTGGKYLKVIDVVDNTGKSLSGYDDWKNKYVQFRYTQTKNELVGFRYQTAYDYLINKNTTPNSNEFIFTLENGAYKNRATPAYLWANPGSKLFSLNRSEPVGYSLFDIYTRANIENTEYRNFTNNLSYISIPTGEYYLTSYDTYKLTPDVSGINIKSLKINYLKTDNYKNTDPTVASTNQNTPFAFIKADNNYLYIDPSNNTTLKSSSSNINDSFIFVITPDGLFYNYKNRKYLIPPEKLEINALTDITLSDSIPFKKWWVTKSEPKGINSLTLWNLNETKWDDLASNMTNAIDFCSQHDTINNKPFLDSNIFENTCVLWANNNPKERLESLNKYCNTDKFKSVSNNCLETTCDEECKRKQIEYCSNPQNNSLTTDECIYACDIYSTENNNCNRAIKEYCSVKDRTSIYSLIGNDNAKKLCSTYLPEDFYKTYYDSLKNNTNLTSIITTESEPICYFPFISKTKFQNKDPVVQQKLAKCTDKKYSCFSSVSVDNTGKITSPIVIQDDSICKEFTVIKSEFITEKDKGSTGNVKNTTLSFVTFIISSIVFVISFIYLIYVSLKKYGNENISSDVTPSAPPYSE